MYQKNLSRDLFYTTGIFMGRSYFWKILSIQKDPKLVFIPNLGFQKKQFFFFIFFIRKKKKKKTVINVSFLGTNLRRKQRKKGNEKAECVFRF